MRLPLFNIIFIITIATQTITTKTTRKNSTKTSKTTIQNVSDYCDLGCAQSDLVHEICINPEKKFIDECPPDTEIISLEAYQDFILKAHNAGREFFASGNDTDYPPASRMGEMSWDNELAELAEYNVRSCIVEDPYCYTTPKYPQPGRSANITKIPKTTSEYEKVISEQIVSWLNTSEYLNTSMIVKFPEDRENLQDFIGRAILDKNNHVGCAASQWISSPELKNVLLVCLYPSDVETGKRLYRKGSAGTRCKTDLSENYTSLCSIKEIYDYTNDGLTYHGSSKSRRKHPNKRRKNKKNRFSSPPGDLWTLMFK